MYPLYRIEHDKNSSTEYYLAGPGIERIIRERSRQIASERYSSEHDDEYVDEELALAAVSYALSKKEGEALVFEARPMSLIDAFWPHDWAPIKRGDRIRDLEKAGALIAAEIDRLLRIKAKE